MRKKKQVIISGIILALVLSIASMAYIYSMIKSVPKMFKQNEYLKSEGYYMAEFEFKMLGCVYYLDKGQYITAVKRLHELQNQLDTRQGLIKIPQFNNPNEELEFYLGLQSHNTGAFMDDSYPLFTYIGPTANVLYHIEYLCQATGQPLHLKYPLRFLGNINTPEKLKTFLDDLSYVGWIGAKFRTPYIEAAELNCYPEDMQRTGLYNFSDEWKHALLQWFYENQDPKTGYWGAKMKGSGDLLEGDIEVTEKVLKLFTDMKGNNLYSQFPLRHKSQMFKTTLQELSKPLPYDLSEVHSWTLRQNRGTRLLIRYLWKDAAFEDKTTARKMIEQIVRNKFKNTYIRNEGAFSLYPGSLTADLDGTGETLSYLNELVGAFSSEKQRSLWKDFQNNVDMSVQKVETIKQDDINSLAFSSANSFRLYDHDPGGIYMSRVLGVFYPKETPVLDSVDLLPRVKQWTSATPQIIGNWVTKESIIQELEALDVKPAPVFNGTLPLDLVNDVLLKNHRLYIVGFDVLQIACWQTVFILQ